MTATLVEEAPATAAPELLTVPLKEVHESEYNTRRHFPAESLQEIADSLKAKGQLTPGLARPHPKGKGYELAAGARRRRGLELAGIPTMLLIVRPMTDIEFLEVITIENLQREDVTALEEASGYHALLNLPLSPYDVPTLAAKVGKSKEYIYGRLNLLKLAPEAKKALETERITPSHAALLVPLKPEAQKEVLKEAFRHNDKGAVPSVRAFDEQIGQTVRKQKREDGIKEALAQATKDHPDAKKIYQLKEYSYSNEPDTLNGREWKAVPKSTDGALVGVIIPDWHDTSKPRVVYFERVKERESKEPAYGSAQWQARQRERDKRAKERDRRKAAGEIAVRKAFAAAAKQLGERAFLAAVVDQLILQTYFDNDALGEAFDELVGLKVASRSGRGMMFRTDKNRRGAIAKLSPDELKAASLFLLTETSKSGVYDAEATERTAALAKLLKIDIEAIEKEAGKAADEAHKAKLQTSATTKLRKAPKAKKRAGDVARAKRKKRAGGSK